MKRMAFPHGAILVLSGVAIFLLTLGHSNASDGIKKYRDDEVIVGLAPGASVEALNARYGTTTLEASPETNQYRLRTANGLKVDEQIQKLNGAPNLTSASPNYNFLHGEVRQRSQAYIDQRSQAFIDGSSPSSFFGQASATLLRLKQAQQISRGTHVRVAVIDTGIDFSHPVFAGRIAGPYYDFVDDDPYPREESGGAGYGHGTFVAGLIVLAAPEVEIMPLRAFAHDGTGTSFAIAKAIRFAVDNGAQVINMSFGMLDKDPLIDAAVDYASNHLLMVAAAGNDNANLIHYPAVKKGKTMSVTATDDADRKASFANFNRDVILAAPGVGLYSAYPGGVWAYWSGTSFSTALVTGEIALVLSLGPNLNRSDVETITWNAGRSLDSVNPSYPQMLGRVRIDCLDAVNRALAAISK